MLNIKFMGKYEREEQILRGVMPKNAVKFEECDTTTDMFKKGACLAMPIILLMLANIVYCIIECKSTNLEVDKEVFILSSCVSFFVLILLTFLHEIIHALFYPLSVQKEIWIYLKGGAMFVYTNEPIMKIKWIWMCLAPNILLGFLPYIVSICIFWISPSIIPVFAMYISWIMFVSGVGDYYNVYNAIKQVPKNGKIFNYGLHSYWIKQ